MGFDDEYKDDSITEVISEEIAPFTIDDVVEDTKRCSDCEYLDKCPTIRDINKMSMKRDHKQADDYFYCYFFKREEI